MKKRSAVLLITACTALCALVWPQAEQSENIPTEPEPSTVNTEITSVELQPPVQPEPILTEPPITTEVAPIAEKEEVIAEQADIPAPPKPSAPDSPPQAPADLIIERPPPPPPITVLGFPASAMWRTAAPTSATTPKTYTRTATKSVSWGEQIPCPVASEQSQRYRNNTLRIIGTMHFLSRAAQKLSRHKQGKHFQIKQRDRP